MTTQPVDHIARTSLPWRHVIGLTECGLAAASYPTISREAYKLRLEGMGRQRCALFTCMTCADVVNHWRTWEEDPVSAMQRETGNYHPWGTTREKHEPFRRELLAIATLIEMHREEFDSYLAGLDAVVRLDDQRQLRAARSRTPRSDGINKKV